MTDAIDRFGGWIVAAALAGYVIAPLVVAPGIPLFLHDWIWSPYADRTVWTAAFSYSAWIETGLGEPNSTITANPLAWAKVAAAFAGSGRTSQLLYLFLSLACAFAGVFRIARRNLQLTFPWAVVAVAFFAGTPLIFDKIASGQSSYWAATAAFVWGVALCLDAFESGKIRDALRSGACFALATVQLQFLVFALIAYLVGALTHPRRRSVSIAIVGILASSVLAAPEIWFLAQRGPEAGAGISPPYHFWLAAQSERPRDAFAMLGYSVLYAERALGGPQTLGVGLVRSAGWVLALAAAAAVVVLRTRPAAALAGIAAAGLVYATGIYGPAGAIWQTLFAHVPLTWFLREYYHGAVLYALGAAVLAAAALASAARRFPVAAWGAAAALAVLLGLATWTGGLGRILPFTPLPAYRDRLAAAVAPTESRVLFLPAQQPLATQGDEIGGNDGLDWIDARRHSMYEYYLPPLVAYVEGALYRGDAAAAARILPRLGCGAVVYRSGVTSLGYAEALGKPDRTLAALREAFGAPTDVGSGVEVFTVTARPLVDGTTTSAPAPADLRAMTDASAVYLDLPGSDPASFALGLYDVRPDPDSGWIRRRDAPRDEIDDLALASYGIVSRMPGAGLELLDVPPGRALVWAPTGLEAGGSPVRSNRPSYVVLTEPRMSIRARGPAVISELGETPLPVPQFRGRVGIVQWSHDVPWEYRVRMTISGRGVLILRERYDPSWRLIAPGLSVEHFARADGFANAWVVTGSGPHDVRFAYAEQPLASALLATSFALFAAIAAIAFLVPGKSRRVPAHA